MRRLVLIGFVLALVLALTVPAPSQVVVGDCSLPPVQKAAFAFETLTVTYTPAVAFTAGTYAPTKARAADIAVFSVEAPSSIRYRVDGTAPTATIGHHTAAVLTPISVCGASNIARFSSILPAGSNAISAVVNVTYYRVQ
jgi:hypothetical protein